MLSNSNQIQCSASSTNHVNTSDGASPLQRDPGLGHDHWQLNEDHHVIHDMAIAEARTDAYAFAGDRIDVLKMIEDIEDILSLLSDTSLGEDSSKILKELRNTGLTQNRSSRDSHLGPDTSCPLEQAFSGGAINGRPQEISLAMERKVSGLHETLPWHPSELVSNPAENSCIKEPEGRQEKEAYKLDGAVNADEDIWSIKTVIGDVGEDMEEELRDTTETVETL
jgi:hypothetical protein